MRDLSMRERWLGRYANGIAVQSSAGAFYLRPGDELLATIDGLEHRRSQQVREVIAAARSLLPIGVHLSGYSPAQRTLYEALRRYDLADTRPRISPVPTGL